MKRYLLFCFDGYYPVGGWNDFRGSYDTLQEAVEKRSFDYYHVIDSTTGTEVASG